MEIKEEISEKLNEEEIEDLDWSPDQEILLLYSLHGFKPVGPVKFFNMVLIQERLSNAMNKQISSKAIWKKLNSMYNLEALDEADAEQSSLEEVEFSLPESEFGELINAKITGKEMTIKVENEEEEYQNEVEGIKTEIKVEDTSDDDTKESPETSKRAVAERGSKKESAKRGTKKKESAAIKDNILVKKENVKEGLKKDNSSKNEISKDLKKVVVKEEKKEPVKKTVQDLKKDTGKEDKKELPIKSNKRESTVKSSTEQTKKEIESKKTDQKKTPNQRGGASQLQPRSETPKQITPETKRTDTKTLRSEIPKTPKTDSTTKPNRIEALRKDDKKKEVSDKTERKSPEKTPESGRGSKLRARDKKTTEPEPTGTKRTKDSMSKASDISAEEPPSKKAKISIAKGRPTRNSIEPQQKPVSPSPSPTKRRARP